MEIENEILELKKNVPETLNADLMNLIDSKEVLNKTFDNSYKVEIC